MFAESATGFARGGRHALKGGRPRGACRCKPAGGVDTTAAVGTYGTLIANLGPVLGNFTRLDAQQSFPDDTGDAGSRRGTGHFADHLGRRANVLGWLSRADVS